jgi:MoaA/NifB/PqqE/SkfB family radical SAM enzyme
VDEEGRLILPPQVAARHGLQPGAQLSFEEEVNGLHLCRPVTHLAKLYVEPTAWCNLACRTCIRNVWDEPLGTMPEATFARIIAGLRAFSPPPTVFFGGYGEPLAHPQIVEMVTQAKALGGQVELITNGTLLTETVSRQLIAAGLDQLWVSLDGATPESYADVRLGAALPTVLANLARFRDSRPPAHLPHPQIGIAFVAMRRNIADLPVLLRLGSHLGATHFLVSNLLPHTAEMGAEILYTRALIAITYLPSTWVPHVSVPKLDVAEATAPVLYQVMHGEQNISLVGNNLGSANDHCPFVARGAAAVGWDGSFSPCLALLHSHASFLNDRARFSRRYVIGNVGERDLGDLWNAAEHVAFRERVAAFGFSPCTFCGGCELSEMNEADCYGNSFPTCGGCLWAQGVLQCP